MTLEEYRDLLNKIGDDSHLEWAYKDPDMPWWYPSNVYNRLRQLNILQEREYDGRISPEAYLTPLGKRFVHFHNELKKLID